MDCATAQSDALRAFRLGDGGPFGGQTTPNKVSASATVHLGRVDTNGGGFGRELSLRARGSGMVRTIPAEMPQTSISWMYTLRRPKVTPRTFSASWCNSSRKLRLLMHHTNVYVLRCTTAKNMTPPADSKALATNDA
jgi:hypothetical protein